MHTNNHKRPKTKGERRKWHGQQCLSRCFLMALCLLAISLSTALAQQTDSVSRWGVSLSLMKSQVVAADQYVKKWLKRGDNHSVALELLRAPLPKDSDAFAADYGNPTFAFGLRYTFNNAVRLHRDADADWGQLVPVAYTSPLGNTLSIYATFYRPLHRSRHWETAYSLSGGVGFSSTIYNKENAIDNEFIGSHASIYFAAGLHQTLHLVPQWGLRASFEFVHHSNGALYRPNKGSNTVGASLALLYTPYYEQTLRKEQSLRTKPYPRGMYLNVAAGIGAKTLLEDWLLTQFGTSLSHPDYRTEHFRIYAAYSLQADVMWRYARRWSSGFGVDAFYGTYARRVEELDKQAGQTLPHSPFSLGLAAKHKAHYGRLSLDMSVGVYLYRRMGANAKINETPYYERIGLHYALPWLNGPTIGVNVKAHKTKADLTELVVGVPIKL